MRPWPHQVGAGSMQRRLFIRRTGGIVAGGIALGASAGAVSAVKDDQLVRTVQQAGTWDAIVPGSQAGFTLEHYYRSETRPLRMKSNVGGVVSTQPRRGGIELRLDLTDDDAYGSPGFSVWEGYLNQIKEIRWKADGPIVLGLSLGVAYNDGTIAEWEAAGGNRERWVSFDGDDRALTEPLSVAESPIDRNRGVFTIPSNGGACDTDREASNPCSGSGYSIQEIQNEFGNIPIRVAGSIDGGPGTTETVQVTSFEVVER